MVRTYAFHLVEAYFQHSVGDNRDVEGKHHQFKNLFGSIKWERLFAAVDSLLIHLVSQSLQIPRRASFSECVNIKRHSGILPFS